MAISAVGAVATFVVMSIFAITKFTSGAWFILLLVPALVFIFFRIHHHYKDVAEALSMETVSYTHLDVYKRQADNGSPRRPRAACFLPSLR